MVRGFKRQILDAERQSLSLSRALCSALIGFIGEFVARESPREYLRNNLKNKRSPYTRARARAYYERPDGSFRRRVEDAHRMVLVVVKTVSGEEGVSKKARRAARLARV